MKKGAPKRSRRYKKMSSIGKITGTVCRLTHNDGIKRQFLINLLEFQTGRPFVSKRLHMDHWSQMIWDLLQISANSYFNRRHAGFNNTPRGSEIMDFFTEICNQDSNQDLNQVLNQDKENYGISTLLIVRNSQEQE